MMISAYARARKCGLLGMLTVTILSSAFGAAQSPNATSPPQVLDFDWSTITPSEELQWSDCYPGFQCARLSVPLDYTEPDVEKAAIAIIKFPAAVDQNDERYKGPLLFNPGGPGGSGVELILTNGPVTSSLIGDDFDHISFDPRGVGQTTPKLNVFSSQQESLAIQTGLIEALNASTASLGRVLSYADIFGDLTEIRAKQQAEHVSTPEVARDMLSIVKAHGMDKLQYWGYSYGSILGATFAAMFPDNVGAMVLDGVADAENYYATLWNNSLLDADKTLMWFYEDCVQAGPEKCPIWEPSAVEIKQRVNNVLERLKVSPVPFVNSTDGTNGFVDYNMVKRQLLDMVYFPYVQGGVFASAFAALEAGHPEAIWVRSVQAALSAFNSIACTPEAQQILVETYVGFAIFCSDGAPVTDSQDDLKRFMARMSEQSIFADVWPMHVVCSKWKVQAKDKFQGVFEANTSSPILFVGNTADPVTPLRMAHKMAQGFPGSAVLEINAPGHTTLGLASTCAFGAIRDYFRNGTLPAPGTVCQVESTTFTDEAEQSNLRARGLEDSVLFEAAKALQRNVHLVKKPF